MRSEQVGSQTVLAQIVQMVAQAQRSRAPMQRMADTVAGWFVLGVVGDRAADLLRLGAVRARAELGLRADQRGGGADHRLPLRARPGHADVDHGRHRPRRDAGRAVPRRRGDREPAQGRHADRRQDRHAHRGQAGVRPRGRRAGLHATTRCCAWPRASTRAASIRWPPPSSRAARERGPGARQARAASSRRPGIGVRGTRRRARRSRSATRR